MHFRCSHRLLFGAHSDRAQLHPRLLVACERRAHPYVNDFEVELRRRFNILLQLRGFEDEADTDLGIITAIIGTIAPIAFVNPLVKGGMLTVLYSPPCGCMWQNEAYQSDEVLTYKQDARDSTASSL